MAKDIFKIQTNVIVEPEFQKFVRQTLPLVQKKFGLPKIRIVYRDRKNCYAQTARIDRLGQVHTNMTLSDLKCPDRCADFMHLLVFGKKNLEWMSDEGYTDYKTVNPHIKKWIGVKGLTAMQLIFCHEIAHFIAFHEWVEKQRAVTTKGLLLPQPNHSRWFIRILKEVIAFVM